MPEGFIIEDQSYAGDAASYFLTRPVIGMDTVQKGCIHVEDGIKKTRTIPRIEVSNFVQRRKATPTSGGKMTVDGQKLTPRDFMVYIEFNPREFESHWQAVNLSDTLLDRQLPLTVENFVTLQLMKRLNEWYENAIWRSRIEFDDQGDGVDPTTKGQLADDSIYFYFDGLIVKLLRSTATKKVANAAILVTGEAEAGEENILDAFKRVYKTVPKELLFKYGFNGLKFHVSYATQQLYEEELENQPYKNQDHTEKGINRYKGYEIVPLAGMPDNTIIACVSSPDIDSNLWVGVNSKDDEEDLKMAQLAPNSELWFIKGLMKMDTNFGFGEFVVIYTTITL